jgi:hypothetical protein
MCTYVQVATLTNGTVSSTQSILEHAGVAGLMDLVCGDISTKHCVMASDLTPKQFLYIKHHSLLG